MKTKREMMLASYQFENKKGGLKAVIFGNTLLFVLAFFGNFNNFHISPFALMSLISALLVFGINRVYNWKNAMTNFKIVSAYLLIFIFELILFGIPNSIMEINAGISKGIFMEILFYIVPFVYTGIRIALVIPLVMIYLVSKDLK